MCAKNSSLSSYRIKNSEMVSRNFLGGDYALRQRMPGCISLLLYCLILNLLHNRSICVLFCLRRFESYKFSHNQCSETDQSKVEET